MVYSVLDILTQLLLALLPHLESNSFRLILLLGTLEEQYHTDSSTPRSLISCLMQEGAQEKMEVEGTTEVPSVRSTISSSARILFDRILLSVQFSLLSLFL